MFVPVSGTLIASSGIYWGTLASDVIAAARDVDDATVSGALAYWFNEDSWDVATPGSSGLESATSQPPTSEDSWPDRNTPSVASGEINGLDALYCTQAGTNRAIFDTSPSNPPIGSFQGTDVPITSFMVARADRIDQFQCIWSLCRFIDNNDGQRQWFIHTEGRLGYFERDNVNVDWRNIGAQSQDLDNKVAAGDVFLFTTATSADGTTLRCWKDNVEWTIDPSGLEIGLCSPVDAGIGLNSDSQLDSLFTGMICEIATYASGMNDDEIAEIGQGLMNKWGI